LAVTPEDAERLIFNTNNSAYTLALRGKHDDKIIDTKGTIVTDMVPQRLLPYAAMPGDIISSGVTGSSDGTTIGTVDAAGTSGSPP